MRDDRHPSLSPSGWWCSRGCWVGGDLLRRHRPVWHWYLAGYPAAAWRVVFTWRKVAMLNDLAVSRRPPRGLLGDLVVKGDPLRPVAPQHLVPPRHP